MDPDVRRFMDNLSKSMERHLELELAAYFRRRGIEEIHGQALPRDGSSFKPKKEKEKVATADGNGHQTTTL